MPDKTTNIVPFRPSDDPNLADIIIKAEDISVSRAGRTLLSGLDFSIEQTGITTILGPNGAGKSLILSPRLPNSGRSAPLREGQPRSRHENLRGGQIPKGGPDRRTSGHGRPQSFCFWMNPPPASTRTQPLPSSG